jgi:hypothetical protein
MVEVRVDLAYIAYCGSNQAPVNYRFKQNKKKGGEEGGREEGDFFSF